MGKVTGFMEIDRQVAKYQPASDRIRHFREFTIPMSDAEVTKQAARCMDCGIPYCHGPTGCPVHNQIPDWNDLVYNNKWEEAIRNLHSTNNFPEFTGRVCPAPCEEACTLNLEDAPVAIKTVEQAIADKAYELGFIVPQPATIHTGRRVAVIGSGPSGLAAAQQLGRAGHEVHVYERESKPGGLLRYGIPDFKMEKNFIDRRVEQIKGEGVTFHCGVNIGVDMPMQKLLDQPFWLDPTDPHRMAAVMQVSSRPIQYHYALAGDWRHARVWEEYTWAKAIHRVAAEGLTPEQLAALGTSGRLEDSEARVSEGTARQESGVKAKIDEIAAIFWETKKA